MRKKWIITTLVITTIAIGGILVGPIMSSAEQPDYDVISSSDNIQIRRYAPMIIAEVKVEGERRQAIRDGFRLLADYIFGNNTVSQDIAMTTPVQQQANKKIAMTAPVQQQASNNMWTVSFVMPSEYNIKTLPKPNNEQVKIKEVPSKKYIAIRFAGTSSNNNIAKHEAQLIKHIKEQQLQTIGSAQYAFYNPPWTLPFMRRNEVIFEIVE